MRNPQLPFNVAIDDSDTPRDVLDALILAAFTTGEQPYAHTKRLPKVFKDAALMPESGSLERVATDNGIRSHLVCGDGWTLRAVRWRGHSAEVTVTATSDELAHRPGRRSAATMPARWRAPSTSSPWSRPRRSPAVSCCCTELPARARRLR